MLRQLRFSAIQMLINHPKETIFNMLSYLINNSRLTMLSHFKNSTVQVASSTPRAAPIQFQMNRHLFFASPDYLELKYVINPWMKQSKNFQLRKAQVQHQELIKVYKDILGGSENITVIEPKQGLTELCFLGDSVFAIGKKAIFGRLACPERYDETEYVMEVMKSYGIDGERVPEGLSYEGSGETLVWNDRIFVGYGLRNKKGVVEYLQNYFPEQQFIGLKLVDPYMYHLDTALFPISNNLIAAYKSAFDEHGIKVLESLDCEILWVDQEDVKNFSLNSVALGQDIIVHYQATKFIDNLKQRGYNVHEVDVSEFMKFGGGLKCLTFQQYLY